MLDELRNLKYYGGKDGLLFFLCDVIGCDKITIRDAEVICSHSPGKRYMDVKELISYCSSLGWIIIEKDAISLSSYLLDYLNDKELLNKELIKSTVSQLFENEVLQSNMFSYDSLRDCYTFKNELLPLSFSTVRNVLISQGFLITVRDTSGTKLYISPYYDSLLAKLCQTKHKQISLEMLKKQLENNEIAGELAEQFVLLFEKKRIGYPLCDCIKRISEIDISAGYDIISFNSCQSNHPDRFIEVKAISNNGFYWSKNEYEISKLKGKMYFLYLVDLCKIDDSNYSPEIIQNPSTTIMETTNWLVEPQSYHIRQIKIS